MEGAPHWGGRTLLVGLLSPLQPSFAVAAVLGVGGIWGGMGGFGGSGVGKGNLVSVICTFACFFTVFAGTVAGVWFLGGRGLGADFPNVSLFPGILSLKLLGN